jgi:hypothetical protein
MVEHLDLSDCTDFVSAYGPIQKEINLLAKLIDFHGREPLPEPELRALVDQVSSRLFWLWNEIVDVEERRHEAELRRRRHAQDDDRLRQHRPHRLSQFLDTPLVNRDRVGNHPTLSVHSRVGP